ncbi:glycosyltransferase family 4 protein [Prosthecobacter sp.]|jgi:glycosyltransferase involved in cell wall biosynthesis|uniref:glycosyltransferase family 4 protein n=1 Tax=Prosthecobacter sp. TaxID=1965333 RepID=UPI0037C72ECB
MSTSRPTPTIDVAYSGVHTAYECALAAQEMGVLREFHCSFYDAPGLWGGRASRLLGPERLRNRRVAGLDVHRVREYPWPWLWDALQRRLGAQDESMAMFDWFDRHCARRVREAPPTILVTTERCALASLQAARTTGTRTLHDCPQLHPVELETLMQQASDACDLPWKGFPDGEAMMERKLQEYELASRLMVYSEFHGQSFVRQGVAPERLFQNPLWVDTDFWQPVAAPKRSSVSVGTLHLLFVGELSLRKGLPFLFKAMELLDAPVRLTLAGRPTDQLTIPSSIGRAEIVATGPLTKHRLRELYAQHDLLVLPSVADAFGWVAVEAMACGIPVLLSDNCGAPVPDPAWRVPAMDSAAIAARLHRYCDHPESLLEDAVQTRDFAAQFVPQRFRHHVVTVYRELVAEF